MSSSSAENDDNNDYEPYTRRDFRIDVKPSDKISNDTSSGYFTSPNENEKLTSAPERTENVFSPEDFEYQKSIAKHRDEYSSSPADSQSGRSASSHCRKSVSFDLDVEEFNAEDEAEKVRLQKLHDEDVFYEQSRYHHQQLQPEPKRIKGILRSPSPSVFYKGNVSSRVAVEAEYIDDEDENPFRKEYLSQEELNTMEEEPSAVQSAISDSEPSDIRYQAVRRSFENLSKPTQSKIPIKKPIFKAAGSLVDRPKIPPPRPPQPNIKVAEMVRNEGLQRMSQHMEQDDFLEFVHNAETNTIEEVKGQALFDPDDPLPPLPKCPPPSLYKRGNSFDRPKHSPPPPPLTPTMKNEEILEILPAKFDTFPRKQRPRFVNENSQSNILVTEDEHREILLTENEMRNAMLTEYDDKHSSNDLLTQTFSSTNPFLDDSSSFDSASFQSTPNVLSPTSTLDKSGSSFGQYIPAYQGSQQHVQPINILPPPAQVLPVHYGQLPKPQHAGYYPLMSHQYPIQYNAPSTGIVSQTPPRHQTFASEPSFGVEQQLHHQQQQQRGYLVSGDGQNNFYVTHNVNNTANQQQHQTLLMQSAYGPLSQPSPPNQASLQQMQMHMQPSHSQYVASTQANNIQPQFIYEQRQPHQFYQSNMQYQQQHFMESELSPIRINQIPQNFIYPTTVASESKPSMSSFGKQTEV